MTNPLRITHAVLSLEVGGLERVVLSLIREGLRRGQQLAVLCVEKPGDLADEAMAAGAELVSLNKPPGRQTEFIALASAALSELKPDIIHTHQIGAAWYTGPGAVKQRIPVLHTEHGNHFARTNGLLGQLKTRLFYHQTAKWIDRYCCVSAEIAKAVTHWGTVPKRKVVIVPNGIDTSVAEALPIKTEVRRSLGIPPDAVVVGTVGRLNKVKCQDRLLRSAASLREQFPTLQILIVGDGPERQNLERLATELGIAEITIFAGYQSRPELYLRAMDVFALTSSSEGFPVSILEAWAVGVPVVCTSVGGIPEIVIDGKNGLLVDQDDAVGLVKALARSLADPDCRKKMVECGAETVSVKYSLCGVASEYERMYRDLIADRGTR